MLTSERKRLLKRIMELEFVMVELNLYLDTHPRDQKALHDYNETLRELRKLKAEYTRQYGPLMPDDIITDPRYYTWVKEPWPWQDVFR